MTTYADPATRPPRWRVDESPRPPSKPRDPLWAKICLIVGSLVMVVSGTMTVLPRVLADWAAGDVPRQPLIPPELIGENIDGAINLLLLGMDERNTNSTEPIRADTIIIVHIPKTHDAVYMISLPRDAEVDIPDFPETGFKGWRTKINAAFAAGARKDGRPDPSNEGRRRGANLTMMTINNLVPGGLRFNGAAIINFDGFRGVLKAIGGVDMCVDVETRSIHYDKNNKYHTMINDVSQRKVYKVGCYHMADWEALDFARQRHFANGDYTRQRHQQQLLMAIFRKLTSKGVLTDLGKVTELQAAAKGLLTLDLGKTDIVDWIYTLKGLRADDVVMIKTNGGNINPIGNGNERLSEETMQLLQAVHDDTVFEFLVEHESWVASER